MLWARPMGPGGLTWADVDSGGISGLKLVSGRIRSRKRRYVPQAGESLPKVEAMGTGVPVPATKLAATRSGLEPSSSELEGLPAEP